MDDSKVTDGSPANGDQSISKTNGQESVRLIPSARVVALRRKMQGADKRIATRERDLVALRSKLGNKTRKLTQAERRDVRRSVLDLEYQLEQAKDEYRVNARLLRSALRHNNNISHRRLADHRAERRLMSRVPSFTEQIRRGIHEQTWYASVGDGCSETVEAILLCSDRAKFDSALTTLVEEKDSRLLQEISRFESVKNAVYRNIWEIYKERDIVAEAGGESKEVAKELQS